MKKFLTEKLSNPVCKRKTFLVEDHAIVRRGIRHLINAEDDLEVCGEAETVPTALNSIRKLNPEIVIADISLPTANGLELIKQLKVEFPRLPILVFSMHEEMLYAERCLRAGAKGYLMKDEGAEKIVVAIREVLDGRVFVSENMKDKVINHFAGRNSQEEILNQLTDRELEVFDLIGAGSGTTQIARKLFLSVKTIESYKEHLKRKLNCAGSRELAEKAADWQKKKHRL
jgi:DNA-binding NarL/FixJ family response regulator